MSVQTYVRVEPRCTRVPYGSFHSTIVTRAPVLNQPPDHAGDVEHIFTFHFVFFFSEVPRGSTEDAYLTMEVICSGSDIL